MIGVVSVLLFAIVIYQWEGGMRRTIANSPEFSSLEVEALVWLSRDLGPSSEMTARAPSNLLNVCLQLLSSRWAALSSVRLGKSVTDITNIQVIHIAPVSGAGIIARIERSLAHAFANERGLLGSDTGLSNEGIRHFTEFTKMKSGAVPRIAGIGLLAGWPVESDGTRLVLSVHRQLNSPAFVAHELAMMRFIRLICADFHPIPESLLSPRLTQVLRQLERGQSEKQCARELRISHHTVHDYVKLLYKRFGVCSRGELLSINLSRPTR
jgi:DNA-binding CsgD family transcriptional regulator